MVTNPNVIHGHVVLKSINLKVSVNLYKSVYVKTVHVNVMEEFV